MKKIASALICFSLSFAFVLLLVLTGQAHDPLLSPQEKGKGLYDTLCITCHKNNLAGAKEKYLLEKFAYYERGKFYSKSRKSMQALFKKLSQEDETLLARYIQAMKK